MKYLASAVVLLSVFASAAHAESGAHKQANLPRGVVTVEEIPTVVVEAKRWNNADEAAFKKAQASNSTKPANRLVQTIRRGLEYAMH